MSREVIQDFLNLAGVVGIALTNRRMRPYFYGLDTVLDRTKQALGQGVLQVVENVPEGFESFEFHFGVNTVFIYKLNHGMVLVVLTDRDIKKVEYQSVITKVKYLIETDTYNTVAYFKVLLGAVTQHSLPSLSWNENNTPPPPIDKPSPSPATATQQVARSAPVANPISSSNINARVAPQQNVAATQTSVPQRQTPQPSAGVQTQNAPAQNAPQSTAKPQTPPTATTPTTRAAVTTQSVSPSSVSAKNDLQDYKLDELVVAMNKLSSFTTQYLGKVVVTNYWKSSRPDSSWLGEFEVDRSGQVSHPKQTTIVCNPEQLNQIHQWVSAYIKRCKQVIRNFDQMLGEDCLDARQKQLLL